MIKLEINNADALTMLRSGRLTEEVRGNLQTLVLSAMDAATAVAKSGDDPIVRLCMNRLGDLNQKIPVIKLIRQAVTDSHPRCILGLKEAKDFAEGYDYTPITMPESYARKLQEAVRQYGYDIGYYQTESRAFYQLRSN